LITSEEPLSGSLALPLVIVMPDARPLPSVLPVPGALGLARTLSEARCLLRGGEKGASRDQRQK
jgi:hypothetical protein